MKDPIIEHRTNLNSFDEQYIQLKNDLDKWHLNMIERIEDMYLNTLIELDTSYERLDTFRQTLYILLDDEQLTNKTSFYLISFSKIYNFHFLL
jgi:hypothetical protein